MPCTQKGNNGSNPSTLTIGSGVTIQGGSGTIGGYYSGDSVVFDGTLAASTPGGIVTLGGGGSTKTLQSYTAITASNGGTHQDPGVAANQWLGHCDGLAQQLLDRRREPPGEHTEPHPLQPARHGHAERGRHRGRAGTPRSDERGPRQRTHRLHQQLCLRHADPGKQHLRQAGQSVGQFPGEHRRGRLRELARDPLRFAPSTSTG